MHLYWNLACFFWWLIVCEHAFQNVEVYAKIVHYHLHFNKLLFTYDFLWLQLYLDMWSPTHLTLSLPFR